MNKIKVGVIGTGFIGPAHIEALKWLPNIEIHALAESSIDLAQQKAALLGIKNYYGDYRQLIQDKDIKSVHICSPNYLHYIMSKAALLAGKHVICEKPLAMNVEEVNAILAAAAQQRLPHSRSTSCSRQVRTRLDRFISCPRHSSWS